MHAIPVGSSVAPASLRLIAAEVEVRLDEVLDAEIQRWRTFEPRARRAARCAPVAGHERWQAAAAGVLPLGLTSAPAATPTIRGSVDAGAALRAAARVRAAPRRRHGRLGRPPRRAAPSTSSSPTATSDGGWRGEARRFGEGVAILVGDLAFVYADRLLRGAPADGDAACGTSCGSS